MKLIDKPVVYANNAYTETTDIHKHGKNKTLTYRILDAHDNHADENLLHITFDSLTSHDITYVGIIQTARASGMQKFPMPYVLTNCHNTLCAVGGTINEDDHQFALSAAHKYGGIYVPPNMAVIHSYNREMMTGCGRMILGSDSHTRYGALGTMGVGEGGGELAKQLVGRTYDLAYPKTVLVYLHGKVKNGVGPHDVALSIVQATYANGFVKNCSMEFAGPGIHDLSQDFRNGIDVMTTETTCWSSIWETDAKTQEYYAIHGREADYAELKIEDGAYYDACLDIDLAEIECMIALPMHPSYALPINELKKDPKKYLKEAQERANSQLNGKVEMNLLSKIDDEGNIHVDQGIIAGCSGGIYENICIASEILKGKDCGNGQFRLSVYPDSQPSNVELMKNEVVLNLLESGAVYREAFCGPCFGAGDTPANKEFSIRHTTRNFPNREGSKPNEGQLSAVALMDARSIAATALHQGILTAASDLDISYPEVKPAFNASIYEKRVYNGYGKADPEYPLVFGPNIKDWPSMPALSDDLLIKIVSYIDDPVTTTDELIPSGETSSFRSNPLRLAEFTLSRRDPSYVANAKKVAEKMKALQEGSMDEEVQDVYALFEKNGIVTDPMHTNICSSIYANKPGDGSAREQAASCQRVLGAGANFAEEYATKRYRSNCINWGILPFLTKDKDAFTKDSWVLIKDIRTAVANDAEIHAYVCKEESIREVIVSLGFLTEEEKQILLDGCLINYYKHA